MVCFPYLLVTLCCLSVRGIILTDRVLALCRFTKGPSWIRARLTGTSLQLSDFSEDLLQRVRS